MNWDKYEENEKVYWNKPKIIETDFEQPNVLLFKCTYNEEETFKKIIITKQGRKSFTQVNIKHFNLITSYSGLIAISKKVWPFKISVR